jgi:phospholipid/cholesterol/gamma-HCH transport system substrate-binding protein
MKFKIRFAEQVVGIFVLLAIVAVAAILIFVGVNQRWFARNYHFTSRFETGGGLAVGMPIMLKGFEIGKVSRVSLNEDNQVDIEFSIQDTYYGKVLPYSILELTSSPIGLGVTLKFHPGAKGGPPVEEGSFIPSLDIPEGRALVEQELVVIPRGEDVIGSVIAKVNPILEDADQAARHERGCGPCRQGRPPGRGHRRARRHPGKGQQGRGRNRAEGERHRLPGERCAGQDRHGVR